MSHHRRQLAGPHGLVFPQAFYGGRKVLVVQRFVVCGCHTYILATRRGVCRVVVRKELSMPRSRKGSTTLAVAAISGAAMIMALSAPLAHRESLPDRLADSTFWRLVSTYSEP